MDVEHLTRLIDEHGLSADQDAILAAVRPAIFLHLAPIEQRHAGQSRIGGVPDLPASLSWPKDPLLGRYLCFLLQINFADLPTFPDNPLPRAGMLYLFASENDDYSDQLVIYTGSERLQPRQLPNNAEFITDWYDELTPHRLTFALSPDIPRWSTTEYDDLCARLDDDELLDDLGRALSSKSVGKLLGHASGIGHDPREDAYVVREVNPEWLYDYEQRQRLDLTHARSWHNLLEIDSSQEVNVMFGDAGYLQILIHGEDLTRQDFSRVYVNLESS